MFGRKSKLLTRIIGGIDHANDAIAIFDSEIRFIYCNRAFKLLHHLDPDVDYTGQSDSVMDIPELRPEIEALKPDLGPGYKHTTRKKLEVEGKEKVFQISVSFIEDSGPPAILVMFRDVTELENARDDLKKYRDRLEEIVKARTAELEDTNEMLAAQISERLGAEKSFRQSEEYARTLFKALPIPTFTFRRQDGTFVFAEYNDAALKMTDGQVANDVGKGADVVLKGRSKVMEDLEKCFSEKKTFEYERKFNDESLGVEWDLSVKYVFVPPDTIMVHTENITARVSAERELKEHRDRLQELVRQRTAKLEEEIVEREKAQDALIESELKYRMISEMTSDYTFVASLLPDGTLRREWMAGAFEKITGYSREELAGMLSEFSVIHPEDRPLLMKILPNLKTQEPVEALEFRMISKSGEPVWVEALARPLPPSEEGYPRGMIAVKDINDRKTVEMKLARRNRELAVVNRIREIFDSEARDREVMDMILEALLDNSEALSAGVCSVDRDAETIEIIASKNVSDDFLREYGKNPLLGETAARIIDEDKVVMIQDEPDISTKRAEAMREYGVYQTSAFPVRVDQRETAIFLVGYGKDRELGPEKMRFFDIVRNQVRLQFERRVLLADREWHERKLRELAMSLIGLLEEERNQMALKLHDELGQEIVAVNAELFVLETQIKSCENDAQETLATIKEQLKKLTETVRNMSYAIHPAVLEDLGLRPALSSYIDKFIESDDLHVELVTVGFDGKLVGDEALTMYRVAQEALTNVVKHSEAKNAMVRIIRGYPDLIMAIEDDGRGFAPGGDKSRGKGLGIINMRERLEGMGGRFRIISAPGKGTRIRALIPMEEHDEE